MELPIILINFKCYITGNKAVKLAKACGEVAKRFKINVSIVPQFTDIPIIKNKIKIPIFSQHIDTILPGAHTGRICAESIKSAGAIGTLINHSERRLNMEEIEKCIKITKRYGLVSVCCSDGIVVSKFIAKMGPDFIAYEPPELIGTGISVSEARSDILERVIEVVKKTNPRVKVLCGAGITSGKDFKRALELGTQGILVASGVVKSENPKKTLTEFARSIIRT